MSAMTRRGFVKGAALAPLALQPLTWGQQTPAPVPSERFDIVVAGAGHNSLITTAYLAKAGYRCLVLEGRPIIGGGVKTAEILLAGFQHDTCSSAHTAIFDNPLMRDDELKLGDYGLEYIHPDPVFHMPFPDGSYITQWRDPRRTAAEFGKFSKKDEAAYLRMMEEYESVHHTPTPAQKRRIKSLNNSARMLAREIQSSTPSGPNQMLAIRHVEDALTRANMAILEDAEETAEQSWTAYFDLEDAGSYVLQDGELFREETGGTYLASSPPLASLSA
jgi:phytoene dehydrogenase-like protein